VVGNQTAETDVWLSGPAGYGGLTLLAPGPGQLRGGWTVPRCTPADRGRIL
jgi:hypothetical protein